MYKTVCGIYFTIKLEIRVSQNLARVGEKAREIQG